MNKILVAVDEKDIFKRMLIESKYSVFDKDIIYKEGILEVLEKNDDIDIVILNSNLYGDISFEELIKKIKLINENLKLIIFLGEKDKKYINFLNSNNIFNLYDVKDLSYEYIIQILENNLSEKDKIQNEIDELKRLLDVKKEKSSIKKNRVILIIGSENVGKSVFSTKIAQIVEKENQKITIIALNDRRKDYDILLKHINMENEIEKISDFVYFINYTNDDDITKSIMNLESMNLIIDFNNSYNIDILNFFKNETIIFLVEASALGIYKGKFVINKVLEKSNILARNIKIVFTKSNRISIKKLAKMVFNDFYILGFCNNHNIKRFIKRKILK